MDVRHPSYRKIALGRTSVLAAIWEKKGEWVHEEEVAADVSETWDSTQGHVAEHLAALAQHGAVDQRFSERGVPGIPGAPAVRGELFVATSEQTDEPGSFVVAEVSCIDGRLVSGGCQWGKSPGEMLGHVSLPLQACDQAGEACELVGWRCAGASVGDEAAYVGVTALCETEGGAL